MIEIWVDTEIGVNYVFHRNENVAGFTLLLDKCSFLLMQWKLPMINSDGF